MIKVRTSTVFILILAVSAVWFVSCRRDSGETTPTHTESVCVTETETSVTEETTAAVTDVTQTVPEEEEIPVYLHPDGREFSDLFADYDKIGYGCIRAYWDTGSQRVLFEAVFDDEWNRYLYINGHEVFKNGFFMLNDIRVTDDYIIVVTSGTDVNSHHLYLFDFAGQLLYETYYLTDHGMIFQSLEAVEADRILLFGTRIYHGPSLLMPDSEKVFSGAYASYLYEDPISDVMESEEVTADNFGEVPLYPDRASVDPNLNPDLVLGGVYALPYLGDGVFGKIELVETVQTLGMFLDDLYGEYSPVTEPVDITLPADADLAAAVDHYLDLLMEDVGSYSNVQSVADMHPDIFDALVALGEDAVPLLQERGQGSLAFYDSSPENFRRMLACTMAQAISPQLYQTDYPSPDGKYAVRAEVDSHFTAWDPFQGTTYMLSLIDLTSGETLDSLGGGYSLENASVGYDGSPFLWSEDSRYAVYESGYRHYFTNVYLIDTVHGKMVLLPAEKELEAIIGENLIYTEEDFTAEQVHCHFAAWYGDCMKIDVLVESTFGGGAEIGYYLYDINFDQIIEFRRYETSNVDTELIKQAETNLDLLLDGAGDLFSESEIIAKNPDAFDALVSLGTEALSYLQTAAADVPAMIADGESMKRLQRASLAMMAAYMIDPSLYDISVSLPDGKTEVTAKIGTFMALDFGGTRVNAYDRLVMTDLETGEVLAVHGFSEDLINVKLECTPDGRYVVYQWGIGSQHGFTTGGVFDTVWGWLQPFPTKEAFLAVLCPMTPGLTDLNPSDVEGISHTVTEWNADGNAIIYFNFRIGTAILTEGTYRFDPATGAVLDLHTHVHHLNTE